MEIVSDGGYDDGYSLALDLDDGPGLCLECSEVETGQAETDAAA